MAKNKGTKKQGGNKKTSPAQASNKAKKPVKIAAPAPLPPWEQAYERGNYAAARKLAKQAVQGEHAASAQAVLDKISVDKIPLIVFALCLLLISSIAFFGLN